MACLAMLGDAQPGDRDRTLCAPSYYFRRTAIRLTGIARLFKRGGKRVWLEGARRLGSQHLSCANQPVFYAVFTFLCGETGKGFDIPASAVTPIVLAAGASSRMGRPKAFLHFFGCAVVDLVLHACQKAHLGCAFVVIRPGDDALRQHLAASKAQPHLIENPHPEIGQTSSLKAALPLVAASSEAFLIYPVDHPLVRGSDIDRLYQSYAQRKPGTFIVAPSYAGRRGHPVLVDTRLATDFLALPDGGSARDVMQRYADRTEFVVMDDDRVLMDIDTPEDYEACLARFKREAASWAPEDHPPGLDIS